MLRFCGVKYCLLHVLGEYDGYHGNCHMMHNKVVCRWDCHIVVMATALKCFMTHSEIIC